MSDLNPKPTKITLNNQEYSMQFTINAIDDIQDHFNKPISELSAIMRDEKYSIRNLRYLITVLINEDIDIQNDAGANIKHVDERYIGRQINTQNMRSIMTAIFNCFSNSTPKIEEDNEEEDSPNSMSE